MSMTAAERTRSKLAREKRASARPQEHRGERERKHDMKSDTSAADKLTREKNVRMRQQSSKAYQKRVTKDRNNRDNILICMVIIFICANIVSTIIIK